MDRIVCSSNFIQSTIEVVMETLPIEILSEIFSYLDIRELLLISQVSRIFHSVINSRVFLKNIWANFTHCDNFEHWTRNYVNLKIHHAQDGKLKECLMILSNVQSAVKSVQHLKIDDAQIVSIDNFSSLITTFPSIKVLHLEGIKLENIETVIRTIKFTHLKTLKFFYSTNVLLDLFTEISNQLETFEVCLIPHENETTKTYSYNLVNKILRNNKTLRKLNFFEINFDDQFLEQMSSIKLPLLRKFSMSFNLWLTPESSGFEKFVKQHAPTLEKFKIRTFDHISEHHLKVLTEHAINIKSLYLIICSSCEYKTFSNFTNLQNLEKLRIQPTNYCSSSNLSYVKFIENKILIHRNLKLNHLTLEMIPNEKSIIDKIILSFPNLITLSLSSDLEIEVHQSLLQDKLKQLRKLVLNNKDFSGKSNKN